MKRLFNIAIWTVLITGLAVLLGFSSLSHKKILCKNIDIKIEYNNADTFLKIESIQKDISSKGDLIIGKSLDEINTSRIEDILGKNPYIKEADAYTTVEGYLKISVLQRIPIVRIINRSNEGFYIDSEGLLMPLSSESTTRVLVASGNIKDSYSLNKKIQTDRKDKNPNELVSKNLQNIFHLAQYIDNDAFLKTMIEQVYINRNDEIELIPKIGNQLIIFGNINEMEEKFNKLKALYKDGFKKTGWNKYKTINLKYKNQVICSKK